MKELFEKKKVTIMGLGLHGGGAGVAKFFCRQGARVLVTDLKTKEQLKESLLKLKGLPIEYVLGQHREQDFKNTDLIIKNPAVPDNSLFLKIAKKHSVSIESDISVFFKLCPGFIIGITGTKGKSTTATLIYDFLKSQYPNAILAGNIGVTPLEFLEKIGKKTKVVLELSSFELEDLKKSPAIAVITNIYPDHLNRYKSLKEYVEAKTLIFKYQKKNDILVLNYDNLATRKLSLLAPSSVYFYSIKKFSKKKNNGCYLKNGKVFFNNSQKPFFDLKELKLFGQHNLSNVLAALTVAKTLKVSDKNIYKVLKNFKGIPWRQQLIKINRGVRYFNDTAATMPEASLEAVKTLSEKFPKAKIILIAGGVDKGLSYKNLAKEIKKRAAVLILLPGSASDKIQSELKKIKSARPVFLASSMKEAVKKSVSWAQKGDIVLLSPAASSFNLFKNEFDRGRKFNEEVKVISKPCFVAKLPKFRRGKE